MSLAYADYVYEWLCWRVPKFICKAIKCLLLLIDRKLRGITFVEADLLVYYCQFGCRIHLMVGPKKQNFWPNFYVFKEINFIFVSIIQSFEFGFGHFWQWSYDNKKTLRNLSLHFPGQDEKNRKNIMLYTPPSITRIAIMIHLQINL